MKKERKRFEIRFTSIIGLIVLMFSLFLVSCGPADPIILTEEEEAKQNEEQSKLYATVDLSSFNSVTIDGQMISSDIFKDYDITMVNIWFTGCSPCIAEMPDIEELYEKLPKNFNVITICTDSIKDKGEIDKSAINFAKEVMSDANAKFYTIIPDDVIKKQIVNVTTIFPTTIFVDSSGKIIGNPHFGGRTSDDYLKAIEERSNLLKKDNEN